MSEKPNLHIRDRAVKALKDSQMRAAVRKAVDRLSGNKDKAAREIPNWEDWRTQTFHIRKHTVENLDYYLGKLVENVRENGGQVHFCGTADEARQTIAGLCQQYGAKLVVKSKSMVTEEIHLNKLLIQRGFEVMETDLAEYILQLADETPSHIIVPAIHKNRYQIAELFSKVAGYPVEPDTPSLTAFARKILREKFMNADIGITGCNFAIAETGSVTLVTNEGNARLSTTIPKALITVMGMERMVPTFEDLEVVLSMLPRAATGQKHTSYMSVINGTRPAGHADGPEKWHLVIVDNGRTNMLGDDEFRQALHCIRCGACFNVCPVYRQIGGHAYASIYGGPIGSVITPLLENDIDFWGELAYASSLCGACTSTCPAKIPIHDLLFKLRNRRVNAGHTAAFEKFAFSMYKRFFKMPGTYKFAMKAGSIGMKVMARDGYIRATPPLLANWTNSRYLPAMPGKTFRDRWEERKR